MISDNSWTRNYTPDQVEEIRALVTKYKFSLITAANMVAPSVRKKVRAPSMKELETFISAQRAAQ